MLKVLKAQNIEEHKEWLNIWENWEEREVFAHPNYLSLYQNSEACCAIYQKKDKKVIFPFCLRKIDLNVGDNIVYDIITPYGYGDIYYLGEGSFKNELNNFRSLFESWAVENNVVSEFIRFDLLSNSRLLYSGKVCLNNENIICHLNKGEEVIYREFSAKVRRNIKKAKRSGLEISMDSSGTDLDDFLELYYSAMNRLGAHSKYYLDKAYFHKLHQGLKGHFSYFYVSWQGKKIATALVLVSAQKIYFFLGGSDQNYFSMRPNDLLHYEIINWGIANKKEIYVLGGGVDAGDSLFNFKKGFAPKGNVPFYVGTKIYNTVLYDSLCKHKLERKKKLENISFPEYRSTNENYLI
ncbi:GNAT family N-acetyltransferase [Saccharicrinis aurantiacus]|uniref:GNAT family N-acetyltransferase n=1 Tax=Saccharicrinis aurantiacus TaxID=1849719 RepID=UPI002492F905|nr:GNAT family N-acetyltransferase [Saccharicrinis aurantiacus]